jgi:hypothetical protein
MAMTPSRVADLTVDELRGLIREVVVNTITELLGDPDEGLELREDMKAGLKRSIAAVKAGGKTTPAETVAAKLGLKW